MTTVYRQGDRVNYGGFLGTVHDDDPATGVSIKFDDAPGLVHVSARGMLSLVENNRFDLEPLT